MPAPRIFGGRALTTELKKLAAQVHTVADDGTQMTRAEVLADLIWKMALGYVEKIETRDADGNRKIHEEYHPPVAWAMQYVFERTEGKAPQAVQEENAGMKAADKVRELSRQRLNSIAKVASGIPPVPLRKK